MIYYYNRHYNSFLIDTNLKLKWWGVELKKKKKMIGIHHDFS